MSTRSQKQAFLVTGHCTLFSRNEPRCGYVQKVGFNVRTAQVVGEDFSEAKGAGVEVDIGDFVGIFLTIGSFRAFTLGGRCRGMYVHRDGLDYCR